MANLKDLPCHHFSIYKVQTFFLQLLGALTVVSITAVFLLIVLFASNR